MNKFQVTHGKEAFSYRFITLLETCATLSEIERTLLEYIPTMHVYRSPNRVLGYWSSYPMSVTIVLTYA